MSSIHETSNYVLHSAIRTAIRNTLKHAKRVTLIEWSAVDTKFDDGGALKHQATLNTYTPENRVYPRASRFLTRNLRDDQFFFSRQNISYTYSIKYSNCPFYTSFFHYLIFFHPRYYYINHDFVNSRPVCCVNKH